MRITLFELMLQVINKTYRPLKLKLVMKLCFVDRGVNCWWSVTTAQWPLEVTYFMQPLVVSIVESKYWYLVRFVCNFVVIPSIKCILRCNESPVDSSTYDIFLNISRICVESVSLSSVRPSLGKCICVKFVMAFCKYLLAFRWWE